MEQNDYEESWFALRRNEYMPPLLTDQAEYPVIVYDNEGQPLSRPRQSMGFDLRPKMTNKITSKRYDKD